MRREEEEEVGVGDITDLLAKGAGERVVLSLVLGVLAGVGRDGVFADIDLLTDGERRDAVDAFCGVFESNEELLLGGSFVLASEETDLLGDGSGEPVFGMLRLLANTGAFEVSFLS